MLIQDGRSRRLGLGGLGGARSEEVLVDRGVESGVMGSRSPNLLCCRVGLVGGLLLLVVVVC